MTQDIVQKTSDVAGISNILEDMVELSKSTEYPISQSEAYRAFNLVKSAFNAELKKGRKIQITGFLTIAPVYKPSRRVFNISTKQPMDTKPGMSVVAKVGSKMKEVVSQYDETLVNYYKNKYESKNG